MMFMRSLRVLVALLLLVIQFRPLAAALSCVYEEQLAAACGSAMDGMEDAGKATTKALASGAGSALGTAADRTDCGLATLCAVSAPALLRSVISLATPYSFLEAAPPQLAFLSPGDRAAPPTQPPRA